ncbi:DUF2141 domain-containing protein [Phormidesmis sp. 146-12]
MQRLLTSFLITTVTANLLSLNAEAMPNYALTVTVDGLRNQKGIVCLSLFAKDQGFPNGVDRALDSRCVSAKTAAPSVTFNNLNAGNYAVAVIHDVNEDGKLNTGLFGIPKEGFGFSRNPKILTSAPSFKETAIALVNQKTNIKVQLRYFL